MAYKFQSLDAVLSGTIKPTDDDTFDLGAAGAEWKDLYLDGTANVDAITLGAVAITANGTEINYLDGTTLGTVVASKVVAVDGSKDIGTFGTVTAGQYNGNLQYSIDVAANGGVGMTPFNNAANVADVKISGSYMDLKAGVTTGASGSCDLFVGLSPSGSIKGFTLAEFATAVAGAGLTATNGVLSADASSTPNGIGNAAATLQEGYNYGTTTFTAARSWQLPDQDGGEVGDQITIKAPDNLDKTL